MGTCFGRCLFGKTTICRSSSLQDDQQQTLVEEEEDDDGGGGGGNGGNSDHHTNLPNINFLYRIARRHGKKKSPPTKFIERFWAHHQDKRYSRLNKSNKRNFTDIPLQCLDPQLLFQAISSNKTATTITTTTSVAAPTLSTTAMMARQTMTTANYFDHSSLTDTNNFSSLSGLNPSPASSSLDLEWEHEYHLNKQLGNINYQNQPIQPYDQLQHDQEQQQQPHLFDSSWVIIAADLNFPSKYHFNQNDSTVTTSEDDDCSSMDFSNKMYTSNNNLSQMLMDVGGVSAAGASGTTATVSDCPKRTSFFIVPKKCSSKRTIADSRTTSWSHISTPDSLEWDINGDDDDKFKSEDDLLDNETKELLQEIEWLKNRALNETGENLRQNTTSTTSTTIPSRPLRSISMPEESEVAAGKAPDSS